jgi:hypothetical protein
MPKLFINYRRADSQGFAGRIYDRLAKAFGHRNVFMDIETLQPGEKFVEAIEREGMARNVMLILIGPNWLNPIGDVNKTRLEDPEDYVRREIEMALHRDMHVIPLLLQGAKLPSPENLPPSLHRILSYNAFVIGPDFHSDMGQLIRRVKQVADPNRGKQILVGLFTVMLFLKIAISIRGPNGTPGTISFFDLFNIGTLAILFVAVYIGLRWAKYILTVYSALGVPFLLIFVIFFPVFQKVMYADIDDTSLVPIISAAMAATYAINVYVLVRSSSVSAFLQLQRRRYFSRLKD